MSKKIVKYSLSVLLVALLVLRVDIKDYINNASAYIAGLFDATFQNTQAPADIISLAKNNTSTQPGSRLYPLWQDITSKNKNISQDSVIDLDKIAQENATFEMERVKIIAAEKFARFKAELELIKQQEQKQNSTPSARVNATPARIAKNTQNSRSTVALAGTQPISNIDDSKSITPKQTTTSQVTQINQPVNSAPDTTTSATTVAILNTELHQPTLKTFKRKPTRENNRRILEEKLFGDDTVVIIVNSKNNQTLTAADIRNLYTDKMTTWKDGKKIIVYNLPVNSRTREIFSYKLLHKSPSQAATAASNRVITNVIRNSAETKTARLVVSTVSRNPTAIGYTTYKNVKGKNNLRIVMAVE